MSISNPVKKINFKLTNRGSEYIIKIQCGGG